MRAVIEIQMDVDSREEWEQVSDGVVDFIFEIYASRNPDVSGGLLLPPKEA